MDPPPQLEFYPGVFYVGSKRLASLEPAKRGNVSLQKFSTVPTLSGYLAIEAVVKRMMGH